MCIRQDKRAPVPGRLLGGSDTPAVIEKINKSFMNGEVWGPIGVWKDQMVRMAVRGTNGWDPGSWWEQGPDCLTSLSGIP